MFCATTDPKTTPKEAVVCPTARLLLEWAEQHPHPWKSVLACHPNTPIEVVQALSLDADAEVRYCVALNPVTPQDILKQLGEDAVGGVRAGVALNPRAPADVLDRMSRDSDGVLLYWIAKNPNTSSTTLLRLSKNNNVEVLRAVKSNPKTPALVRQRLSVEKLPQAVRQNPTQSLVGAQSLYAASCEPNFTDLVVDLDEDEIVGAMLRFAKHATPRQWRTGVELLDNWKGTFEELFEASGYLASSPT